MKKLSISELTLLYQGEPTRYEVTSVEGFDDPERRVYSYDRPGEDGAVVASSLYGGRAISIEGLIRGTSPQDYEIGRQELVAVTRLVRNGYGVPGLRRINVINSSGGDYEVSVVIRSVRIRPLGDRAATFIVTAVAPDPYVYSPYGFTSGRVTRPSGGAVRLPARLPARFGAGSSGLAVASNWGEADTWPTVTIRDTATNPTLYHLESGRTFQLLTTLESGDVVVIDMRRRTVTRNGTESLLPFKTTTSDWFALPPGQNTVRFSTASSSDTATVEVEGKAAFLAVL